MSTIHMNHAIDRQTLGQRPTTEDGKHLLGLCREGCFV